MKRWILSLLAVMLVCILAGCGVDNSENNSQKLRVVASFDGMASLVRAVGGDDVAITTIIPDGTEPHDFELKVEHIKQLGAARVFVYNGLGMEPWVQDALDAANNDKLIVVKASEGVTPILLDEEHDEHHSNHYDHGDIDPHAWLSPVNDIIMVRHIVKALSEADPVHEANYTSRGDAMIAQLQALMDEYKPKFQQAPRHDIFTGHAAFGYICRDFGLHQQSVEDVYASGEPNAAQLAALVDYVKAHHITTIFTEEMASPRVSETLANEVGAKVETIYTMEGSEDGLSYMDRMRINVERLYNSVSL